MKPKTKPSSNGDERSFVEIDEHNLEREWVGQPALYLRYAEKAARARRKLDEAEANLDVVVAELDAEIRNDPKEFGLEKITESAIKTTIPMQRAHKEAVADVIDARHELGILNAAVAALDHRKRALENLVSLWQASYYADPRTSGEAKEAMDDAAKRSVRQRGVKQR